MRSIHLLMLGLVSIPWYEFFFRLLPYSGVYAPDTREPKKAYALVLALAIALWGMFTQAIQPCKNKAILVFIFLIYPFAYMGPTFKMFVNGVNASNFWMWQIFARIIIFFLMFMVVSSLRISKQDLNNLFKCLFYSSFCMAVYVGIQHLGIYQFFIVKDAQSVLASTQPGLVGNLGNSTIVSAFIGLGSLSGLHFRKYWQFGLMVAVVFLCKSQFAIASTILAGVFYLIFAAKSKGFYRGMIVFMGIAGVLISLNWGAIRPKIQDSGRFGAWSGIIRNSVTQNIGEPEHPYPITGAGFGTFRVVYKTLNKTIFHQAHNEYIEVYYAMGVIGFGVFVWMLWHPVIGLYTQIFHSINPFRREICLLASLFIFYLIESFGTFIYQVSPFEFIAVTVFGLIHNENITKGEVNV